MSNILDVPYAFFYPAFGEGSSLIPAGAGFDPATLLFRSASPDDEEGRPRLFFTVGSARSGKSTYAKRWVRCLEMPDLGGPRARWCQDDLRLALTGERYMHEVEPLAHALKGYAIKALLLAGHSVLVDGTHTTRESIKRLLEIDMDAEPVVFDTPEEVCVERAYLTGQDDLVPVIARHCRQLRELMDHGLDRVMGDLRDEIRARRS